MNTLFKSLLLFVVASAAAAAADLAPKTSSPLTASLAPIRDVPGLPRILLVGDSISMGYTLEVRASLAGLANVHRPPTNCNSTGFGLAELDKWLGREKWDIIHFNFGLHDAKLPPEGNRHAPPNVYEENLRKLVFRLKATGAKLIWATTTPIPLGGNLAPNRRFGSVSLYNEIARKVMTENGVAINDLNRAITPFVDQVQIKGDVHFLPEGYSILARETVTVIREHLANARKAP